MLSSLIFIVSFLRSYVAVTVNPITPAAGISVSLINDPRGLNQVDANNRWKLVNSEDNALNNWGLRINLDAETYGFKSGASDSSVTVSVDADVVSDQADLFVGVGVGDQYVTYAFDLDGSFWLQSNAEKNKGGVWTFPQCSTGTMATGDVSRLLLAENLDVPSVGILNALRDALCGGDDNDAQLLTSTPNYGALPVTLQLTSDDVAQTLQITFSTPTYASAPFSCTFDVSGTGASVVGQDLDIFLNNDGSASEEIVAITSVDVTASNVGCSYRVCDSDAAQSVLLRPASPLDEEMNALRFQVHFLTAMTVVITCMIAYLLYQSSAAKRSYGKVYQMDSDTEVENSRLKA